MTQTRLVSAINSAHDRSAKINNTQGESYADIHGIDELYRPRNSHNQGRTEADASRPRSRQKVGYARLEPYGMAILIGLLIVLPLLGSQLGVDLSFVSHLISSATGTVIRAILRATGNM